MSETAQILDHGFMTQCGECGHQDNMDLFTSSPISGDFPPGQYQCPNCSTAWKVGNATPDTLTPRGHRIPGERKIEFIGAVL